jgi:Family of unknown function (DUF6130)
MRMPARTSCLVAGAVLLAACATGGGAATVDSTTPAPIGPRPSSRAVVKIVSPKNGETVPASGTVLEVSLTGATLTSVTSQNISPDEGHLHVSVDDRLISMTSGLRQELPDLQPGRHVIQVEFVAADHLPFDPRVLTRAEFEVR